MNEIQKKNWHHL